MYGAMRDHLKAELGSIEQAGLFKDERRLQSAQGTVVRVRDGEVLNLCANNYLGLSSHPELLNAAHDALDRWGYGLSSVRFICGTQEIHADLERVVSDFLGFDDAILFGSCFDANGALFETLLSPDDAVLARRFAAEMLDEGVYVIGFWYPVVPEGQARIRVQLSAAHTRSQLEAAVEGFIRVGNKLGALR